VDGEDLVVALVEGEDVAPVAALLTVAPEAARQGDWIKLRRRLRQKALDLRA
jgi:hypothetical protein